MRALAIVGVLSCVLGGCCFAGSGSRDVETRSYDEARAQFSTRLVVRGPAPQDWEVEELAADARLIAYRSGDLELDAWVSRGDGTTERRPAVLFLHGGLAFGRSDWEMAAPFREHGFIVMVPMLRGENGGPGSFSFFLDEVDDVVAAARALAAMPEVDPQRVFVSGHSAGGILAMLACMRWDGFRAGSSLSAYPDTVELAREWGVAPYDLGDVAESRMRSPLVFAHSLRAPFRAFWGDEELGYREATEEMIAIARAAGRDLEGEELPGDHFTSVPAGIARSIAFFRAP